MTCDASVGLQQIGGVYIQIYVLAQPLFPLHPAENPGRQFHPYYATDLNNIREFDRALPADCADMATAGIGLGLDPAGVAVHGLVLGHRGNRPRFPDRSCRDGDTGKLCPASELRWSNRVHERCYVNLRSRRSDRAWPGATVRD